MLKMPFAGQKDEIPQRRYRMNKKTSIYSIIIWGMVIGYTVLYISLIFNDNIWTDEAFTWQLLHSGGIKEIISGTAKDVHPPLYYLWADLFRNIFGDNLRVLKIASIVPMTGLLVYGAVVIRKTFGDLVAVLFLLFIANIPCTMEFAVQPRMYSSALFCVTVCGVSAYLCKNRGFNRDWVLFGLTALCSAYIHYFAFVSVGVIGLLLLVFLIYDVMQGRKNKQVLIRFAVTVFIDAMLYLPWFPILFQQITSVNQGYWIPEIDYTAFRGYFEWTFGLNGSWGNLTVYVFLCILFAAGGILLYAGKEKIGAEQFSFALCSMLVPSLTALFGIVVSKLPGHSTIYREQYILPALGMLALFFAISVSLWSKQATALTVAFLLFTGACQYRECHRQEYHNSYVEETKAFLANNASPDDPIIYNWEGYGFIYEYYWSADRLHYIDDFDWGSDFKTAWFFDTYNMEEPTAELLQGNGLGIEDCGPFGIEQDNFEIYKITKLNPTP